MVVASCIAVHAGAPEAAPSGTPGARRFAPPSPSSKRSSTLANSVLRFGHEIVRLCRIADCDDMLGEIEIVTQNLLDMEWRSPRSPASEEDEAQHGKIELVVGDRFHDRLLARKHNALHVSPVERGAFVPLFPAEIERDAGRGPDLVVFEIWRSPGQRADW